MMASRSTWQDWASAGSSAELPILRQILASSVKVAAITSENGCRLGHESKKPQSCLKMPSTSMMFASRVRPVVYWAVRLDSGSTHSLSMP